MKTWMVVEAVGWGGMNWIVLAQDRDQWWARVNIVLNLQVQKCLEIF
jgi:hypothetical protein